LLTAANTKYKERDSEFFPTINEIEDIKNKNVSIDGIISDFPDRLFALRQKTTKNESRF
jgi:hypothetical protein